MGRALYFILKDIVFLTTPIQCFINAENRSVKIIISKLFFLLISPLVSQEIRTMIREGGCRPAKRSRHTSWYLSNTSIQLAPGSMVVLNGTAMQVFEKALKELAAGVMETKVGSWDRKPCVKMPSTAKNHNNQGR